MIQHNYRHDKRGNETECIDCGKKFTVTETGNIWPGGKDTEFIFCPYCHATNGSIRTSGFVRTQKTAN